MIRISGEKLNLTMTHSLNSAAGMWRMFLSLSPSLVFIVVKDVTSPKDCGSTSLSTTMYLTLTPCGTKQIWIT